MVEIPLPSQVTQFLNEEDYHGMVWAVVDVDVSRYLGKA